MNAHQLLRPVPPLLLVVAVMVASASPAFAEEAKSQTTTATLESKRLPASATTGAGAKKLTPSTSRVPGVQPGLGDKSARITEMERARGLKDLRELSPGVAHLPGRGSSLTDPTGAGLGRRDGGRFGNVDPAGRAPNDNAGFKNPLGKYAPALPSNRDKTPNFGLGPSANPRDWMSGSAANGGTTRQRHDYGRHTEVVTTKRDGEGNIVARQIDSYSSDGSFMNSTRTEYGRDGSQRTTMLTRSGEIVDARTGSRTVLVQESRETRGADGTVTTTSTSERRLGNEKHDPPATDPGNRGGIARTIDPSADTRGDGSVCRAMPWVCRGAPSKDPTHVNPGDEPRGFASAPKINPGDSIVVNPSTENVRQANQARRVDPDGLRRAVGSGTKVNPPGPND